MNITIEKDGKEITLGISEEKISENGAKSVAYDVTDMLQMMFNVVDDSPITVTVEDKNGVYVAHNLNEMEEISEKIYRNYLTPEEISVLDSPDTL